MTAPSPSRPARATNRGRSAPGRAVRPSRDTPAVLEDLSELGGSLDFPGHVVGFGNLADPEADQLVADLSRKAKASGTLSSYQQHMAQFQKYCTQRGLPAVPAPPRLVAQHLAHISVAHGPDGKPLMRGKDDFVRALHVNTVQVRMFAIDYAHKQAGYPPPSHAPEVKLLLQSLRRMFSVAPDEQRAPVDLPDLSRLVAACHSPTVEMLVRDVARRLAAALDASAGQLQRLDWHDIRFTPKGDRVVLSLTRADASRKRLTVTLKARTDIGDCPVHGLRLLRALTGDQGPVLRNVRGQRLATQSVRRILTRQQGQPVLRPSTTTALRDEVLLLVGWWSAVRRSNLSGVRWEHLDWRLADSEGIVLRLSRGKTDQEGRGVYKALLRVDEAPELCPVRALQRWRAHLTTVLGVDPVTLAHLPVLLEIDRHGHVKVPAQLDEPRPGLSGLAINRRIQVLADRSGLTDEARTQGYGKVRHPFGGHSLRTGWMTAFLSRGGALHEGAAQLDHVKLDTSREYSRRINALDSSPNHRLLASLARAQATPRSSSPVAAGARHKRR